MAYCNRALSIADPQRRLWTVLDDASRGGTKRLWDELFTEHTKRLETLPPRMEGSRRRSSGSSQSYSSVSKTKKARSRSSSLSTDLVPASNTSTSLSDYEAWPWRWQVSYCNRALLARLLVDTTEDNTQFHTGIFEQCCIKAVKFFSRESEKDPVKVREYEILLQSFLQSDEMMSRITDACPHFRKDVTHIDRDSPLWKQVAALIDQLKLQFHQDKTADGIVGWRRSRREGAATPNLGTSKEKKMSNAKMEAFEYAKCLVTKLEVALATDMMNGQGKTFVEELTAAVQYTLGMRRYERLIECTSPSVNDRRNTKIEMVAPGDTTNWNRAYSTEPPEPTVLPSSADADVDTIDFPVAWQRRPAKTLPVQKASSVVPDVTWALPDFPGQFPLVVKLKPDNCKGILQCFKEMLSKLFFQNVVFGLLLTPRQYFLLFAHKNDKKKEIEVSVQNPLRFANMEGTNWDFKSETFFQLAETLCKIMDCARKMSGNKSREQNS